MRMGPNAGIYVCHFFFSIFNCKLKIGPSVSVYKSSPGKCMGGICRKIAYVNNERKKAAVNLFVVDGGIS